MTLIQSLLSILLIIFIGIICQRKKIFDTKQIEGFEIFLFKIAMPAYLFTSTLHHDFAALINVPYICSYLLSFIIIMMMVYLYFYKTDTSSTLCIKVLASGYVNAAIFTLPVITFLLGDPVAGILGNVLQVLLIQSFFITILSLINHKEKSLGKRLLTAISTPLIFMPSLGLLFNYFEFIPNTVITSSIQNLGIGASGFALFTFGLTLGSIKLIKEDFSSNLLVIVFIKNIIHPFVSFIIGKYIVHLEGYWLYSLIIATSAPTAFVVYLISKQFSIEAELVKKVVAITSILSLASLIFIAIMLEFVGLSNP